MTALSTLLSIIPRIGYSENDTSDIRMEKAILVSASLALVVITFFMGRSISSIKRKLPAWYPFLSR
jgi:hypothetical protein